MISSFLGIPGATRRPDIRRRLAGYVDEFDLNVSIAPRAETVNGVIDTTERTRAL